MYYIYGKNGCHFCDKAIELLKEYGKDFTYFDTKKEYLTSMGFSTFPQVFLKDDHIGGFNALLKHLESDENVYP